MPRAVVHRKSDRQILREARRPIFKALLDARQRYGGKSVALIEADDRRLTYTDVIRGAFGLGSAIARKTKRGERVGIMLPTSVGTVVAFFALLAYGRVPAMINFTGGITNIAAACKMAEIKIILTAHQFIEVANLSRLERQVGEVAELVYLEDTRENLSLWDKVMAIVGSAVPWMVRARLNPDSMGVILFTSGTEGAPKGVVLSHTNIVANVVQINGHVELERSDILFNPLPTFHCYGLTAGTLFPIFSGAAAVMHPSPLQTKIIPKRIQETGATVLVATDTFLQHYARASNGDELKSLMYAVCGAERVRDETRSLVKRRFDLEVLEGYGVTETAPVLAVNQPGNNRSGTVGRLLPAVEARIEPVDGLEEGGRLMVRGPNIMLGYLSVDRPGELIELEEGWHDTGDAVTIDEHGFVSIRDRIKRFAKIAGEMVSLTVVENCASATWSDYLHAAVSVPDDRKGEQIILVTECPDLDPARLRTWAQQHGVSELTIPRRLIHIKSIPVLGTGKTDYVSVKRHVLDILEAEENAKNDPGKSAPAVPVVPVESVADPAPPSIDNDGDDAGADAGPEDGNKDRPA